MSVWGAIHRINQSGYSLMKLPLLFCLGWSFAAQAQGGAYSAPGMPLHLQHGVPVVPVRPVRKTAAAPPLSSVLKAAPVLPRFWQLTDSARKKASAQLNQFASSQAKYPHNTLHAGIDGIVYVRLTVGSDGTVTQADIIRRTLSAEGGDVTYSEKGKADLDAEVLRVARALRFQPSVTAADTVTISQRFVMQ